MNLQPERESRRKAEAIRYADQWNRERETASGPPRELFEREAAKGLVERLERIYGSEQIAEYLRQAMAFADIRAQKDLASELGIRRVKAELDQEEEVAWRALAQLPGPNADSPAKVLGWLADLLERLGSAPVIERFLEELANMPMSSAEAPRNPHAGGSGIGSS